MCIVRVYTGVKGTTNLNTVADTIGLGYKAPYILTVKNNKSSCIFLVEVNNFGDTGVKNATPVLVCVAAICSGKKTDWREILGIVA